MLPPGLPWGGLWWVTLLSSIQAPSQDRRQGPVALQAVAVGLPPRLAISSGCWAATLVLPAGSPATGQKAQAPVGSRETSTPCGDPCGTEQEAPVLSLFWSTGCPRCCPTLIPPVGLGGSEEGHQEPARDPLARGGRGRR